MWPFNKKLKYIPPEFSSRLNPETFKNLKPSKEITMTEDIKSGALSTEQTLDQEVAATQRAKPINIIEGYTEWTNATTSSLTESRNTLAERIERDQEELRQIDKVIKGIGLMETTINEDERDVSKEIDTFLAQGRTRSRKAKPIENAS